MDALIVAVIALIVASTSLGLWVYGRFHLREASQKLDAAQERLASVEQTLVILSTSSKAADQRLSQLEHREAQIEQLKARQEDLENQQEQDHPYAHAIRLVRQGASARRLIDELYLSESEANLIVRLHGSARTA